MTRSERYLPWQVQKTEPPTPLQMEPKITETVTREVDAPSIVAM